jgi:hypothetical protein
MTKWESDCSIWDLRPGDQICTEGGEIAEVVSETLDGDGLVVRYLYGNLKDETDFVFEGDIARRAGEACAR